MSSLLIILLSSVFVSYFAVANLPALQPFVSTDVFDSVVGLAVVIAVNLALLSPLTYLLEHALLRPFQLEHLAPVAFIALILVLVHTSEAVLRRSGRWIPRRSGFALLMMSQAVLYGVALIGRSRFADFAQAVLFGLGIGASYAFSLLAFCSMQQRLLAANIPVLFRQAPVGLITAGLMALALMGLTGLIRE